MTIGMGSFENFSGENVTQVDSRSVAVGHPGNYHVIRAENDQPCLQCCKRLHYMQPFKNKARK